MGKSLPIPEGPLALNYVPRPQFKPYHERRQRHAVMICHRRAGKTVGCINDLLMRAIAHSSSKPPGRFGFISPTYTQARKDMGDAQYFSEFECDPTSPIVGAYFGDEMKKCDLDGRLET
jgi:hypothetical protein